MKQIVCLAACLAYVIADIGVGGGRNQYLPPDRGYNYDRPNVGFGTTPQSQGVFPNRPLGPPPPPSSYNPAPYPPSHHEDHHHHEPGMPFDFSYAVYDPHTANDYAHKAVSDGDVTRGEYRVALPDGRTQIVRYTADWKNGYNAEVTYEGEAHYPEGPYGHGQHSNNNQHQGYIYK